MEKIDSSSFAKFFDVLGDIPLETLNTLGVVSLGISLFAVVAAYTALHRSKRAADPRIVSTTIHQQLEGLRLLVDDSIGKWNKEVSALREDIQTLEKRLDDYILTERQRRNDEHRLLKKKALTPEPSFREEPKETVPPLAERPLEPTQEPPAKALSVGLQKTRSGLFGKLRNLFSSEAMDSNVEEALEELLISSDLGVNTTKALLESLSTDARGVSEATLREHLKATLNHILASTDNPEISPSKVNGQPLVILMVGVNGVGKTTTIAKLGQKFTSQGAKVLFAAGDTFRAAAVEQLEMWAQRVGAGFVSAQEGAKPSTVAYQAIHRAREEGYDVVLMDTAGRLHTRVNLMNELKNVISIINREQPGAPHHTLLVLDASTGQNALQQAREFHSLENLSGIVITKLDGTPKGGILVAIKDELGVPIRYIGIGESAGDLRPFVAKDFIEALLESTDELNPKQLEVSTKAASLDKPKARRRRRAAAV